MDALLDEIESLEAILMDDVKITRNAESGVPEMIETIVLPTVGEEIESQYVRITLQVIFTPGYPDAKPNYNLRAPRGLDDSGIENIRRAIECKLVESLGSPVVFDLIDVIREHLTDSNLPSGQCVVCLYGFQNGDEFTKTECYHYLHSYCLARHLDASKRNFDDETDKLPAWQQKTVKPYQACCPVCREIIGDDAELLRYARQPCELQNAPDFELTNELKGLQARMANLYMHQKKRGGIIDSNAEDAAVISIQSDDPNEAQARKTKNPPKVNLSKIQTNQARQAAALAARNATMEQMKNEDDDEGDDEEDDNGRRRQYGRRGGNRHNRRNVKFPHPHQRHHQQANVKENAENGQASCSNNKR